MRPVSRWSRRPPTPSWTSSTASRTEEPEDVRGWLPSIATGRREGRTKLLRALLEASIAEQQSRSGRRGGSSPKEHDRSVYFSTQSGEGSDSSTSGYRDEVVHVQVPGSWTETGHAQSGEESPQRRAALPHRRPAPRAQAPP
ncbi:hypothetical protein HD557_004773 [Nocardioides luteus]|nr:hypothetical protein [Nocardioides luteus]